MSTHTDVDGHFTLAKSAFVAGGRLRDEKLGYLDSFLPLIEDREADLTIRLRDNATTANTISGIVLDPANQPGLPRHR